MKKYYTQLGLFIQLIMEVPPSSSAAHRLVEVLQGFIIWLHIFFRCIF